MLFENILDKVYEVLLNVLFKFHVNSCGLNRNLSDDEWVMILIQFELLPQPFTFIYKFPIW